MADIIVGEKIINKAREIGTIVSFDDQYIYVEFKNRTARMQLDAFDNGFIRYQNPELQGKIDAVKDEQAQKAAAIRSDRERAAADRRIIQEELSSAHFNISLVSASIRLDPAPLTLTHVRKNDKELVERAFAECDKDIRELYALVTPDMIYRKYSHGLRSKYCVGFMCKYAGCYVFRAFSRNDIYDRNAYGATTVKHSDTTEVLRILLIDKRVYCFSKNLTSAGEHLVNTKGIKNWHISKLNNILMLNKIVKMCDCGYLNNYIEESNIDCIQYIKFLFPAFYNNKVEIVFKNKMFLSMHRVDDVAAYLEEYNHRQIDYASRNNVINTLPVIKRYGNLEIGVLLAMEKILKKRSNGLSLYGFLEDTLAAKELECNDLTDRLIRFVKKIDHFDATVYWDYIRELSRRNGVALKDFFDKDYMYIHDIMVSEREVYVSQSMHDEYSRMAAELSWIDREENDYFIIVPKTIAEFKHEGEKQHNCVYTMEYYRSVVARESIIVFLRKNKTEPFVTIEYDYETFEVYQAYAKYNENIPSELYNYIVELGKRLKCEKLSHQ